jgi:hypothetical protein
MIPPPGPWPPPRSYPAPRRRLPRPGKFAAGVRVEVLAPHPAGGAMATVVRYFVDRDLSTSGWIVRLEGNGRQVSVLSGRQLRIAPSPPGKWTTVDPRIVEEPSK